MLDVLLKPWVATCDETREQLSDYLDDELPGRARSRIARHLARCERCRALLESLERVLGRLRSLGEIERVGPEPATVDAVLGRIRHERR